MSDLRPSDQSQLLLARDRLLVEARRLLAETARVAQRLLDVDALLAQRLLEVDAAQTAET